MSLNYIYSAIFTATNHPVEEIKMMVSDVTLAHPSLNPEELINKCVDMIKEEQQEAQANAKQAKVLEKESSTLSAINDLNSLISNGFGFKRTW